MKLLAAVAVTALVAAACGGDDDDGAGTEPATESTGTGTAASEPTGDTGTAGTATEPTVDTATSATSDTGSTGTAGSEGTGGGSAGSTGLPHAEGDQTAKVMVLTDVTQGQIAYSAPEAVPAVQAAFAGFPNVEVIPCDAKGDQNEYLNCQRQAVDEGVVGVVVGWSAGGAGGEDILTEAGIPVLGGGNPAGDLAYSISSGNGAYLGLGAASAAGGCTEYGILMLESTDMLADMVRDGAVSQGGTELVRAPVPSNAPDLSPAIAKILGEGVNCIVLSVSPPMLIQAMTAINQSGEKPLTAAVGAILPQQVIDALGPLSEGMLSIEAALSSFDDAPVLTELADAMAAFDSDAPLSVQSNLAFVAGHLLATALSQVDGEVTPAAVVAQLDTIKDLDMGGIVPPVTVQELDNAELRRFMNPWSIAYQIRDGKPVRFIDDFVDLRPAIEAAK